MSGKKKAKAGELKSPPSQPARLVNLVGRFLSLNLRGNNARTFSTRKQRNLMKLRDISLLSVFSPLRHGDSVILEGESGADEWFASRADCGWSLKNDAGELHPAIKEIDGMNDFIGAIIEWQSAYFTRF